MIKFLRYPNRHIIFVLLLLLFFTIPQYGVSQFYKGLQQTFGKSRVQWNDNYWTYYKFSTFDTYFYKGGKNLAIFTAKYAAENIKDIQKKLDYNFENKIQFIIFNSLSDLKQSNIGLISDEQYNVGGITHIIGSKVFLYNDGCHENLKKQIKSGIAQIVVNELFYGDQIAAKIKNSALIALPDWYLKGLVSYLSEDWNVELDNYVRDGIMSKSYERFNLLSGMNAVYAGHSIWYYIAQKYGANIIPNILYMTKISKNVENGFLFVMGVSFKTFSREWIDYYDKLYYTTEQELKLPEKEIIIRNKKKSKIFTKVSISPDGKSIAYIANDMGKIKLYIKDLENKKRKVIMKMGHRLDEKTDYSFPIIAWHPLTKRLAIITERKGKLFLNFYNTEENILEKQRLFNFQKVLSFSYSQSGTMLVMSAIINGQTDIFVYNLASHTYENITNDSYDDFDPVFMNNSKNIIFSSNRFNDTLYSGNKDSISYNGNQTTDLFLYNYVGTKKVLRRITKTQLWNEFQPAVYETDYLSFLSDKNGIVNRFVVKLDSAISFIDTTTHYRYLSYINPQTNYKRNILSYSLNPITGKSTEIIYYNGIHQIYQTQTTKTDSIINTELINTPYANKRKVIFEERKNKKPEEKKKNNTQQKQRRLTNVTVDDTVKNKNNIDINDYSFSTGVETKREKKKARQDSIAKSKEGKKETEFMIPTLRNYDVEYTINQMVNQADFSFLNDSYQPFTASKTPIYINPGFNALFKVGVTDLLEDYRITGGISFSLNLTGTDYLLSFENLKKRLDKQIVFYRQNIENNETSAYVKHSTNELQYILKWPFSQVLSIKGTCLVRNDRSVYAATDYKNLKEPNIYNTWAGLKSELIFDNTREQGLNLYFGTRYKFFAEVYRKVDEDKLLSVFGFDYRRYIKISRTFIWANRFAASTSLGNQKLIYYMGGVDNWLFPKFNERTNVATNQNYAYQTLATNMRGFTQNVRNGNSFAVLNSELRFPIFRYLMNRPLKSEFFNNFQLIGFSDIGTAWTGSNPYSDKNALYTDIVQSGPVKVTIKTEKEPIVGGLGLGARTKLLGYFVRADFAWGVEDGAIKKKYVFYLSMSLDF